MASVVELIWYISYTILHFTVIIYLVTKEIYHVVIKFHVRSSIKNRVWMNFISFLYFIDTLGYLLN